MRPAGPASEVGGILKGPPRACDARGWDRNEVKDRRRRLRPAGTGLQGSAAHPDFPGDGLKQSRRPSGRRPAHFCNCFLTSGGEARRAETRKAGLRLRVPGRGKPRDGKSLLWTDLL